MKRKPLQVDAVANHGDAVGRYAATDDLLAVDIADGHDAIGGVEAVELLFEQFGGQRVAGRDASIVVLHLDRRETVDFVDELCAATHLGIEQRPAFHDRAEVDDVEVDLGASEPGDQFRSKRAGSSDRVVVGAAEHFLADAGREIADRQVGRAGRDEPHVAEARAEGADERLDVSARSLRPRYFVERRVKDLRGRFQGHRAAGFFSCGVPEREIS